MEEAQALRELTQEQRDAVERLISFAHGPVRCFADILASAQMEGNLPIEPWHYGEVATALLELADLRVQGALKRSAGLKEVQPAA